MDTFLELKYIKQESLLPFSALRFDAFKMDQVTNIKLTLLTPLY